MLSIIAATLLALIPCLTTAQGPSPLEWTPSEMYNPQLDPKSCGLKPNDEGYICDPNKLLGDDIHRINWVLKDAAYNNTRCPCSNYYCETARSPRGYRIGVALVKKMKLQTSIDGQRNTKRDQAQLFAYTLENDKWNMGRCEEDIIIFYSADDKTLAIYGGTTAMMNLNPYYIDLLTYRSGTHFSEGRIVEGLNNLLFDLKVVLNCENPTYHDCGLHEIRNGVSGLAVSLLVTLTASLLSVWNVLRV